MQAGHIIAPDPLEYARVCRLGTAALSPLGTTAHFCQASITSGPPATLRVGLAEYHSTEEAGVSDGSSACPPNLDVEAKIPDESSSCPPSEEVEEGRNGPASGSSGGWGGEAPHGSSKLGRESVEEEGQGGEAPHGPHTPTCASLRGVAPKLGRESVEEEVLLAANRASLAETVKAVDVDSPGSFLSRQGTHPGTSRQRPTYAHC